MSDPLTAEENERRLIAKKKLANSMTLIVIEDVFIRAYVKNIFSEMIEIQNTVECSSPDEAKSYLDERGGKKLACIISSVDFMDGSTGVDFISFVRSNYRTVRAPMVLIGDDPERTIEYVFMVKHFAGNIGPSFTPSRFISMLLEIFDIRDRRRVKRELVKDAKGNRPFNRLHKGG